MTSKPNQTKTKTKPNQTNQSINQPTKEKQASNVAIMGT